MNVLLQSYSVFVHLKGPVPCVMDQAEFGYVLFFFLIKGIIFKPSRKARQCWDVCNFYFDFYIKIIQLLLIISVQITNKKS